MRRPPLRRLQDRRTARQVLRQPPTDHAAACAPMGESTIDGRTEGSGPGDLPASVGGERAR
jgi:hypothetical protein